MDTQTIWVVISLVLLGVITFIKFRDNFSETKTSKASTRVSRPKNTRHAPIDNFTYIAENVATIYYMVKNSDMCDHITEEEALFITGVCASTEYVRQKESFFGGIFFSVKNATHQRFIPAFSSKRFRFSCDARHKNLVGFILNLESIMFAFDTDFDHETIADCVLERQQDIADTAVLTYSLGTASRLYEHIFFNFQIQSSVGFETLIEAFHEFESLSEEKPDFIEQCQ